MNEPRASKFKANAKPIVYKVLVWMKSPFGSNEPIVSVFEQVIPLLKPKYFFIEAVSEAEAEDKAKDLFYTERCIVMRDLLVATVEPIKIYSSKRAGPQQVKES